MEKRSIFLAQEGNYVVPPTLMTVKSVFMPQSAQISLNSGILCMQKSERHGAGGRLGAHFSFSKRAGAYVRTRTPIMTSMTYLSSTTALAGHTDKWRVKRLVA